MDHEPTSHTSGSRRLGSIVVKMNRASEGAAWHARFRQFSGEGFR
jgi:hypothetical protein